MKTKARRTEKSQAAHRSEAKAAQPSRPRWIPDLRDTGRTKYLTLVDSIREAIARGDLSEDEPLPTQRALAKELDVNIATVTKAIAEAGRLGLVVTRPGGRTHVAGTHNSVTGPQNGNGAMIDLSVNVPPVALIRPMLDDVIARLARRRRSDELFGYAPLGGVGRDRAMGSKWIAARGLKAAPDRVIVTQGAHEGLFAALTAATQPGDVVLSEGLNYTGIRRLAELCRLTLVGVATDEGGLQARALAEACEKYAPKAIVCTPVTLNPTTATQHLDRRRAILAIAKRHSLTIVEDDIYGQLSGDTTPPLAALWPDGVIYVTGLSKCVAPGLRVGYLSAPERLLSRLRDALVLLSWTAPSFHAAVASEMIGSGLAEACTRSHRQEALRRMALGHELLGRHFVAGPAATYHGWLRLPPDLQERDATSVFQRRGVLVSPAHHFAVGGYETPAAVRLSLGAVADIGHLERAMRSIAGVLEGQTASLSSIV